MLSRQEETDKHIYVRLPSLPYSTLDQFPPRYRQGLAAAWPTIEARVGLVCRQNNWARFDLLGFGMVCLGGGHKAADQNNRVVLDKQPACAEHKILNRVLCQ